MVSPEEIVDGIKRAHSDFEQQKRMGMLRRLNEVLTEEAKGDSIHPAAVAQKALETGNVTEALRYFKDELEKTEAAKTGIEDQTALAPLEVRKSYLERWIQTLETR